ncbi:MAG TPA: hypothetical protein VGL99_05780 [Chloroflexota bacterium]|jgi:hypothetical protein
MTSEVIDSQRSWCDGVVMKQTNFEPAFTYVYSFRRIAVVVALLGAVAGWLAQINWLLAVSITVGIGEWLECSYYIAVLSSGSKRAAPST